MKTQAIYRIGKERENSQIKLTTNPDFRQMTLEQYIDNINKRYKLGNATEHTFRGDLQQLIESLVPGISATNEPKRQSCGAPDYILIKKDIPIGFIEAKDIGDKDLEGAKKTGNKEQFDRYKASLGNLLFTDYLNFHLYHDGQFITKIAIGTSPGSFKGGEIMPLRENFATFTNLIKDFCAHQGQTIKSSKKLAEMMAGKARLLSDVIEKALTSDESNQEDSTLKDQMIAFRELLIHDITPKGFADVYAQTIAYGMFAARSHDKTLNDFSRQEAAELIPKSNPFLRKLFGYIAGPDLDDRIKWIVDSLVEIFLACNVEELLKDFGKATKMEDPIIHFYETFLSEYDPALRKARGVWYTPQPVVSFIVRAVDDLLKSEFELPQGLADTSKTTIKVNLQSTDKRFKDNIRTIDQEVHKVQILDPATGTGTFLAEVVKHIHEKFAGQQGIWSKYVETHLLPRLNGFELLMASYAMAHLKLDLLLTETGYHPTRDQRFRVYLTNSLEESHPDTGTLFANWLSTEANEANHIKRDTPVMVVMGNPPYSVSSSNKSEWIQNLIADYKKDLNERKINLDDDYIKFIRFGQHFIDKNGSGILAYISNNSFIDGITHRQMRKHLLESFDKIYILDLHGNAKKKEVCPDGSPDQNVFDIMQGVSINLFVKTGKKKKNELGQVFHCEIQGNRDLKYESLIKNAIDKLEWQKLDYQEPYYFFIPKNFNFSEGYEKGFKIDEIYLANNTGIQTKRDGLVYSFSKERLDKVIRDIVELPNQTIQSIYSLPEDGRDWTIDFARKDLLKNDGVISEVSYHPFDNRITYFTGRSKGFMAYPRSPLSYNCIEKNTSLLAVRNSRTGLITNYFITNKLVDKDSVSPLDNCKFFPLYLYPDNKSQQTIGQTTERQPNLNPEIVNRIAEGLGLTFTNEKTTTVSSSTEEQDKIAPIDLLDYIYAVLHSPAYREKYKEFLKIDFPRVPYPTDISTFWQLVKLGGMLRQIHLLESPVVDKFITQYPVDGDNKVGKIRFDPTPALPKREGEYPTLVLPKGEGDFQTRSVSKIINQPNAVFFSPPLEGPGEVNMPDQMSVEVKIPEQDLEGAKKPGWITANPGTYPLIKDFREELKTHPTEAERVIWEYLRNKKTGYKIRRQHVIGNFIPDFTCLIKKVCIEIDGEIHLARKEYDAMRTASLNFIGYSVIRFTNKETITSPSQVAQKIKEYLDKMPTFEEKAENKVIFDPTTAIPADYSSPPLDGPEEVKMPDQEGINESEQNLSGKVYINETQYFADVPEIAWNFYIGGYQPAQKWLKDRKERVLEFEDILHYQKIIVALSETARIMKEIDKVM